MTPRLLTLLAVLLLVAGCDLTDDGGLATLSGVVLDDATGSPVEAATVRLLDVGDEPIDTQTTSAGAFTFEVNVDSTTAARLVAYKTDSYRADTTNIVLVPEFDLPSVRLGLVAIAGDDGGGDDTPTTGNGASIVLVGQSASSIGVLESGSVETAQFTFEVQDSSGVAVDADHAVTLNFAIPGGASPGGGEFVFPQTVTTDESGRAVVSLRSGTKAGVVQLVASASTGAGTFRSTPVAVTIHGGLPDAAHFSIAPTRFNFPAYHVFGETNTVTAYVGDKWSNPVREGTGVYFSSTAGIIEGSTLTGANGQGSVALTSAEPRPADGFFTVTAETADENEQRLTQTLQMLLSGRPTLSLSPSNFTTASIGQTFSFTLDDARGNPMAMGTKIIVEAQGTRVNVVGDASVELDDYITSGAGTTDFVFRVVAEAAEAGDENPPAPELTAIKITSAGDNGTLSVTWFAAGGGAGATPRPPLVEKSW